MKSLASYPVLKAVPQVESEKFKNQFIGLIVSISNNIVLGVMGGDKVYWDKVEEFANKKIDEHFLFDITYYPLESSLPKIPQSYLKQAVVAQIINTIIDPPRLYTEYDWFGLGHLYQNTLNYVDKINTLLDPNEKIEFTKDISPLLERLGYVITDHYPVECIYYESQTEIPMSTKALSAWRRTERLGLKSENYLTIRNSDREEFINEILRFYLDENYKEVCEILTKLNLATKDQIDVFAKLNKYTVVTFPALVEILNSLALDANIDEVIYPKYIKFEDAFLDQLFSFLQDKPINNRTNWLLLQYGIINRADRAFDLALNTVKTKKKIDFWSGSKIVQADLRLRMQQIFPYFVKAEFLHEIILKIIKTDRGLNCISAIIEKASSFLNDILILLEDAEKEGLEIETFYDPDLLIYAINTGLTSFKLFSILFNMNYENREKFGNIIIQVNNEILRNGVNSLDVSIEKFWKKIQGLDSKSPYFNRQTIESEFKYLIYSSFGLSHSGEYESGSNPEECLEAGIRISRPKTDFKLPDFSSIKINLGQVNLSEQLDISIFDKIAEFESSFMKILYSLEGNQNNIFTDEIKSCFATVDVNYKKDLNQLTINEQFDCFTFWLEFLNENLTNKILKYPHSEDLIECIKNLENLISTEYSKFTISETSKSKEYSVVVGNPKLSYLAMLGTNLCTATPENTVPVDLNVFDGSMEVLDMGHFWFIDESVSTGRITFCGESEYFIVKLNDSETVMILGEVNFTKKANKKLPSSDSLISEYMKFVREVSTLNEYSSLYLVLDPYIISNRPNIQKAITKFAKGKTRITTEKSLVVSNDPIYKTNTFAEVD